MIPPMILTELAP